MQMENEYKWINLSYLDDVSNGDSSIKLSIIELFIEQIPEFEKDFALAFSTKNWKFLGQIAHKAKSSILYMGMDELGNVDLKNIELIAYQLYIDTLLKLSNLSEKEINDIEHLKNSFESYTNERKEWVIKNKSEEKIGNLLKKFSDICSYAVIELNCELNKNKVNY